MVTTQKMRSMNFLNALKLSGKNWCKATFNNEILKTCSVMSEIRTEYHIIITIIDRYAGEWN